MEVPQSPFHYERVEIHQINFRGPVAEQQGVGEDSQDHTGRHFEMTITKSEVLYRTQFAPACPYCQSTRFTHVDLSEF